MWVSFGFLLLFLFPIGQAAPQLARNPKLSQVDLEAAQAEMLQAGGPSAELVYAARLDAIQKGSFDSLIVVYAKPSKQAKDLYAFIVREGQRLPLAYDKQGHVLPTGDKYLRIGLKHEEGKSPILRIIGGLSDPGKGDRQRNLDFRFDGMRFQLEAQSLVPLAH